MNNEIKERITKIQNGEIPKGYKKTKVGIVPSEWEVKKLGEVGEFSRGKNISTSDLKANGNCKAMMYGDIYIKYDTKFYDADYRVDGERAKLSTPITKGDLLFTSSGETAIEIGKCVTYQGDDVVYIGGDILALKLFANNSLFLAYQQNSYSLIKAKAQLGQGHSVVHIYQTPLSNIKLPLPPLPEQNTIAEILSTEDKVIELKEKLIEKKEAQKKYLMQNLLTGKKRLKRFRGEWSKVRLGEVLLSRVEKQQADKQAPLMAFISGKGVAEKGDRFDRSALVKSSEKLYKLTKLNDFIYSSNNLDVGSIGLNKYGTAVISDVYEIFKAKSNANIIVVSEIIQLPKNIHKVLMYRQGAIYGQYRIHADDFLGVSISLPPLDEQKAIAEILSTADKEIELLKADLEKEKEKKKALMQLLLTGIVRV